MNDFNSFFIISALVVPLALLALIVIFFRKRKKHVGKSASKVILWNVLILFFLLSVVYSAGETYYRFFVDTTDSFAINKVSQRWKKRYFKYNKQDLRDNINYFLGISKNKSRRLSIIGDSFTEGHGIKDVEDRFANIIRRKFNKLEVHAIAEGGSNSAFQLTMMKLLKKEGYEYDIILLAYCLNDIDQFMDSSPKTYRRIMNFTSKMSYLERNSYFINTLTFRLFAHRDADFMNYCDFVLEGYNGKPWEEEKDLLRSIKLFAERENATLLAMTFPFLQQEASEYSFREVHRTINEFWEKENIPHLDLLETYEPYLGKELTINAYDAHPNEFAHKLAADAIIEFLKKVPAKKLSK